MEHQFLKVLFIDQGSEACTGLKSKLKEHDFDVNSFEDITKAEKCLANRKEPVFVFLYLPDDSFEQGIKQGKKISESTHVILIYVLENVDRSRFNTIRKHNPYGFTTTQTDLYSLFQTLYFSARLFEEQSSANRMKKEAESELNTLATTFQSMTGTELFDSICQHLVESLDVDYAFIGEVSGNREKVHVLSAYGEDRIMEPFTYDLADTPCEDVAGQRTCHFVSGVQDLYPKDILLKQMNVEGYIGIPLFSSSNKPLGIAVLLKKSALQNVNKCEQYLKIYSDRVAAEIERIHAESELRAREHELRSINEHISEGIYRSTPNDGLVYVNDAFASMFGYGTPEELLDIDAPDLYVNEDRRKEITEIEDRQGYIKNMEVEFRRRDGTTFWGLMSGQVVHDASGNVKYYDGSVLDITERKRSEDLLKKSLKEKEVLLAEIHHRVKNNLAIISGLLELEAMNRQSNIALKNVFHESQLRIHSMAMIHEKLYQAGNFSNIKIGNYISELVDIIRRTLAENAREVDIEIVKEQEVELNINQAIPCALILNELVTNAFKYAFDDTEDGKLWIYLTAEDGMITLTIKDNGPGLPVDFNIQSKESLGFALVQRLTDQLEGKLSIGDGAGGACFEISFQKSEKSGSSSSGYIIDRKGR